MPTRGDFSPEHNASESEFDGATMRRDSRASVLVRFMSVAQCVRYGTNPCVLVCNLYTEVLAVMYSVL